jgi:hypothetical protein
MNKKLVTPILIGFGIIVLIAVGWVLLTQEQVPEPVSGTNENTQTETKTEELSSSLMTVIINGQEAKVDLNAVIKNGKVELTVEQYNVILNSLLTPVAEGKIVSKADAAFNAILKIDARLKALEEPKQTEVK